MGGWLETVLVVFVILSGALFGRSFSRLKYPRWCWGYFIPLALVALLLITTYISLKTFIPPIVWFSGGRIRFVIIGFSSAMGAMTLFGRLRNRIEKAVVLTLTAAAIIWASILPFLVPALIQNELTGLQTKIDSDNICSQSTDFTCGPAAAVTALRQLGLSAQEGEIAVLSHASPISGTMPWCLYKALQNRYSDVGLDCRLQRFDSIDQLRNAPVTLAVVKDAFMLDHCVAVLDVEDDTVTIGDPILGRIKMTRKAFAGVWRFYGIVLKHNPS
ncbi:MAG: hypothetical protein JW749_11430 [Sedimentisphaerales bacterium]|nr:hypothetical protein [Sedimentisphaerales bacterium]